MTASKGAKGEAFNAAARAFYVHPKRLHPIDWRDALVAAFEAYDFALANRGALPRSPLPTEGPWRVMAVYKGMHVAPENGTHFYVQHGENQDEFVTNGSRDFRSAADAQIVCDALNRVARPALHNKEQKP